jgi:hypothetical protein
MRVCVRGEGVFLRVSMCVCVHVNPNHLLPPIVFSSSFLFSIYSKFYIYHGPISSPSSLSLSLYHPHPHPHHLSLHCFLHIFSRVSALSRFGIIFVMTHDSIGLGEGDRTNVFLLFIFFSIHLLPRTYLSIVHFVCVYPVVFFCLSRFLLFILLICVSLFILLFSPLHSSPLFLTSYLILSSPPSPSTHHSSHPHLFSPQTAPLTSLWKC